MNGILFVCLGNICRSPLAEVAFLAMARDAGLSIGAASCGTSGYHNGEGADPGSVRAARDRGWDLSAHRSRRLGMFDLDAFDLLVCMDRSNLRAVRAAAPGRRAVLLRDFDPAPSSPDVPDPWARGPRAFDEMAEIIARSCGGLIAHLQTERNL